MIPLYQVENGAAVDTITPGCEWALTTGHAFRLWPGAACLVDGDVLYREDGAEWVPVTEDDREHQAGWRNSAGQGLHPGLYTLVGPEHGAPGYYLIAELAMGYSGVPRDFVGLREWLLARTIHGVMFFHVDGRRAYALRSWFE